MVRRIRTPLYQHWNHFRVGVLPFICFIGCVALTLWMWQRQGLRGSLVGEVEAIAVDVASGADGILMSPPSKETRDVEGNLVAANYWARFDRVAKGDIIAVLDQRLLDAALETITAEKAKLQAELDVTEQEVKLQVASLQQDYERNRYQRVVQYIQAVLDEQALKVSIESDKKEKERLEIQLRFLQKSKDLHDGAVPESNRQDVIKQIEVVEARLYENNRLLTGQRESVRIARKYKEEYQRSELLLPEVDAMFAAIEKAQLVQDARIREVQVQIENLTIRAPMEGVISEIYQYPGSSVLAGAPIVKIAKTDSAYIVSYWREKHTVRPYQGMTVGVRSPLPGSQEFRGIIEEVGPQVVQVPAHQLATQGTPEWAIPVKVPISQEMRDGMDLTLKPGALIHIIYRRDSR